MKFFIKDVQFSRYSASKRFQAFSFLKELLKVVNDAAERGIRLLEEYKEILTENCERNVIMQSVESSRKRMPDFKKTFSLFLHLPVCDFLFICNSLQVQNLNFYVSFLGTFVIRCYVLQTFLYQKSHFFKINSIHEIVNLQI